MNKNIRNHLLVALALTLLGTFFFPATSFAVTPTDPNYMVIPLSYKRVKPSVNTNAECPSGVVYFTGCISVNSGIGIYNWVGGMPAISHSNITNLSVYNNTLAKTLPRDSTQTAYLTNPRYAVVNNELRVYNLKIGSAYSFNFTFSDQKSTDIANLSQDVGKECSYIGGGSGIIISGPQWATKDVNAQTIKSKVVIPADICSAYDSAPFQPPDINLVLDGTGSAGNLFKTSGQKLASVDLTALQTAQTAQNPQGAVGDNCPLQQDASMRWLGCSIFAGLKGTADKLTGTINTFLYTPTAIFDQPAAAKAAATFRNFGIALVLIAGLIMIIAQASGSDLVDAYTIRKLMPRLAMAMVGMALSWPLLKFAVVLTNDFGTLVHSVLLQIVGDSGAPGSTTGVGSSLSGHMGLLLAGGAALAILDAMGFLALIGTVVLALLIGLLILSVRQLVVLMSIILAPLAIAAYVLPGTQKLWGFWKNTFITTLLMYPLIMGFIGAGAAMSTLLGATNSTDANMSLLAIIVYFAPFFLLPFAFKLAGGLMGTIFSLANDKNRGAFDRLKKFRGQRASQNLQDMKTGNRYKGDSKAARVFNASTRNLANVPNAGITPWKMKSRMQAAGATHSASEMAEYMDKNAAFASIKGNDDYLQATMKSMGGGESENDWRRYLSNHGYKEQALEQGVAQIRAAKRSVSNEVFERAAVMANPSTGTGWKEGGPAAMMQAINDVTGNDRHTAATMLAQMRGMASRADRMDLGGSGFGVQVAAMDDMQKNKISHEEANEKVIEGVMFTKGPGEYARARGQAVQNIAPQMLKHLQVAHERVEAAKVSGNAQNIDQEERALAQDYAALDNLHDNLNHMAPENARIIADSVLSQEVTPGVTVMDQIKSLQQGNDAMSQAYADTRKSYDVRQAQAENGRPPEPEPGA